MMIMDEEKAIALMMEALDGVLSSQEQAALEAYLAQHPVLAQEWQMMQQVDSLLRQTPPAATPVHFSERTLARLPNPRLRRLFLLAFYVLLLFGGLLPLLAALALYASSGGALALVDSFIALWSIIGVVTTALMSALGNALRTQPLAVGWLTAMLGAVAAWVVTMRQVTRPTQPLMVRM